MNTLADFQSVAKVAVTTAATKSVVKSYSKRLAFLWCQIVFNSSLCFYSPFPKLLG